MPKAPLRRKLNDYWRDLPISVGYKAKIRRMARVAARAQESRRPTGRNPMHIAGMCPQRRELIHDAVFAIENEIESKAGGQPDNPVVVAMRAMRNRLMDYLGWNEA